MKINETISTKIHNIRLLCCFIVVCIHLPWSAGTWAECCGIKWLLLDGFRGYVCNVAVPTFFLLSGFFFDDSFDRTGHKIGRFLQKKMSGLLIPFLLINLIYAPVKYIFHYVGVFYFGADNALPTLHLDVFHVLQSFGLIPFLEPANGASWFLFTLFVISGIMAIATRYLNIKPATLCFLFVLTVWQETVSFESDAFNRVLHLGLSCRWIFYYTVGIYFSRHYMCSLFESRKTGFYSVVMSIVLIGIIVVNDYNILRSCKVVICIARVLLPLCMLGVLITFVSRKRFSFVDVENAMPIYLLHMPMLYLLDCLLKVFHLKGAVYDQLGYLPIWAFVVMACIGVKRLLLRVSPSLAFVLLRIKSR